HFDGAGDGNPADHGAPWRLGAQRRIDSGTVWFFERGQETIRPGGSFDNDSAEVVAMMTSSDRRRDQARFDSVSAFREWLHAFQAALAEDRFTRQGPPIVLPDGWPDKRLT